MAFHEAVKSNLVKRGQKILFVASGAGLSVGQQFIYILNHDKSWYSWYRDLST